MERKIIISELIKNGLTESNGLILREKIEQLIKELPESDTVVLDFKDISLFATPFFNASIGYFILNLGPEKFNKIFKLEQISELGLNTYQHSYENAVEIYNKRTNTDIVGEITKSNIENS